MFKVEVLGTSQELYLLDVTLRPLSDVFGTFLQKLQNFVTANSLVFYAHIW